MTRLNSICSRRGRASLCSGFLMYAAPPLPAPPQPGQALAAGKGRLFLEELSFEIVTADINNLAEAVAPLIFHQPARERLARLR